MCVVDCPLTDGEGSQLLSNGEEKLAETMVKDLEPRKSIGGLKMKTGTDDWRGCEFAADSVSFVLVTSQQGARERVRRMRRMSQ